MDHSQCGRPSVRDAHIAEALRVLEDCTETMAGDSAACAERPMTDQSGTGGIGSITALLCGTARFYAILKKGKKLRRGELILHAIHH